MFKYSSTRYYNSEAITHSHGSPPHAVVLSEIMRNSENAVAMEVPVFLKVNKPLETLLGHIDLIMIQGETVYICDYKPDQNFHETSAPSVSFINSIPQVATYALLLQKITGLTDIQCVTFNKEGAWVYDPETALCAVTDFMVENEDGQGAKIPWLDYFKYLGIDVWDFDIDDLLWEEAYDGGVSFVFRLNQYFSEELADELVDLGHASYNEKRYMNFVVKNYNDKTIWIKEGSVFSGIMHIYVEHSEDFNHHFQVSDPVDIATLIVQTITELDPVDGPHPASNPDYDFYDYNIEGTILRIIVNRNTGYIITAYPRD